MTSEALVEASARRVGSKWAELSNAAAEEGRASVYST